MRFQFPLFALLLLSAFTFAQNTEYQKKSAELQKSIWNTPNPMFDSNTVPEKYRDESAVVLARSFDMQRISGGKFKFMIITAASIERTDKTTIFREKVKINDKTSLENFSTLEYQKVLDKTQSFLFISAKNKREVYVGVKIIKPDGKEILVNANEEVIMGSSDKDKQGKLAVPGLQVGDIIDYYISTVQVIEGDQQEESNKYFFFLADKYPVLNYSYVFQYNKKVNVFHMSANGAPKLEVSTNEAEDQILTLKGKDMPKLDVQIWSAPQRELPYFAVTSYFIGKYRQTMTGSYDKYDKNLSRLENFIADFQTKLNPVKYPISTPLQDELKDYFKSTKAMKSLPLDSTMKVFYNIWKFNTFCSYYYDNFDVAEKHYTNANNKFNTIMLSQILTALEIPHDILFTTSKYAGTLDQVFEEDDFEAMIRIRGTKPLYMVFNRIHTNFNEIPVAFQGQKAIVMTTQKQSKSKYTFDRSEAILPETISSDNQVTENIQVDFASGNLQKLNISRNVKSSGFMRLSDQPGLLLFEDLDNELKALVNGKELKARLSYANKPRKILDDYITAFNLDRKNQKENFTAEIKEQYGETPKDVTTFKTISSGLGSNPVFEHASTFSMEGFVKKAGNNYILDIGKLIGQAVKIEPEERKRQMDIVMPAARSLVYQIKLNVPSGYKLAGLTELNNRTNNDAGSFSVTAKMEGQQISLTVERTYSKSKLQKQSWNHVLELLDAAALFSEKKVLIEKNKS